VGLPPSEGCGDFADGNDPGRALVQGGDKSGGGAEHIKDHTQGFGQIVWLQEGQFRRGEQGMDDIHCRGGYRACVNL